MKNTISLVLNGVLIIAVTILYLIHFSGKKAEPVAESKQQTVAEVLDSIKNIQIVFVDIDSLLENYMFSKDLNTDFMKKQQNMQTEMANRLSKYEEDIAVFQKKAGYPIGAPGGFMSQQSAELQQSSLIERQQELQNLEMELSNRLMMDQQDMTLQLYDSIVTFVEDYNKKYNYTYILGNSQGGGLLYANKGLNITRDVLDGLNKRYEARQVKKK